MAEKKKKFTFKYVIPDHLQDCYVNGAWGGVTPRKEIHMHLYSERLPIPKLSIHDINKDGTLSKKEVQIKGGNVVRLIQSSVIMDVGAAVAIRTWLDKMIKVAEGAKKHKKEEEIQS